jgi:uncharacterized protein with PQ loop repeat
MIHEYLMNTASVLYILCYLPELYANYKNRNANAYNVPEKVVMLTATTFALSYSILNEDRSLMLNYGPIFALDAVALILRIAYMKRLDATNVPIPIPEPEPYV